MRLILAGAAWNLITTRGGVDWNLAVWVLALALFLATVAAVVAWKLAATGFQVARNRATGHGRVARQPAAAI